VEFSLIFGVTTTADNDEINGILKSGDVVLVESIPPPGDC
jgi:hypothetical protein